MIWAHLKYAFKELIPFSTHNISLLKRTVYVDQNLLLGRKTTVKSIEKVKSFIYISKRLSAGDI